MKTSHACSHAIAAITLAAFCVVVRAQDALPQELRIGYADYPPDHYTDASGKPVGWAVDLLQAAATSLGVPARFTLVGSFQSLLPGVNAQKYHLAVGAFTITEARKQQYDFVSYFRSGNSIVIRSGKPEVTANTMCGKRAAIVLGSYFAGIVENFSTQCAHAGSGSITLMTLPTQEAVLIALDSGRADFSVSTLSASHYLSKQTQGRYTVAGEPFFRTVTGLAFDQSQTTVRDAVAGALQTLLDSGRYSEILNAWGVQDGAVTRIDINP